MSIQQLPVELLMEIFSYLDSHGNVSLVNKHFYDVVCAMKDSAICLSIDNDFFARNVENGRDNDELLMSMQNTKRKISKIIIEIKNFEQLMYRFVPIIKNLSATIKYAKFIDMPCNMSLEILSLMPALEHLAIQNFQLYDKLETKVSIASSNEELDLHQLKKADIDALNMYRYAKKEYLYKFLIVFNRLPAGVLTEISLELENDSGCLCKFSVLFKRQTNIEKVFIKGKIGFRIARCGIVHVPMRIFDNLKLKSLELDMINMGINTATILSKQTNLKSLALYDIYDEEIVNVVVNQLTKLETLKMEFDDRAFEAFANIGNLKKLKKLTLQNTHLTNLVHFTNFTFSEMITLNIHRCNVPSTLIYKLAKSVPNLTVLNVFSLNDYETFNSIRRYFNFVEVLHVRFDIEDVYFGERFEGDYNLRSGCFNSKLTDLEIGCELPYEIPFLNHLISDYPNLKSFRINPRPYLTTEHFKLILNGLPKVEILNFNADEELRDYLKCFKHSKKNLELIYY